MLTLSFITFGKAIAMNIINAHGWLYYIRKLLVFHLFLYETKFPLALSLKLCTVF